MFSGKFTYVYTWYRRKRPCKMGSLHMCIHGIGGRGRVRWEVYMCVYMV